MVPVRHSTPQPYYQAKVTCCRTISGLAQPLVGAAVGPAHKQSTISERLVVSAFNQCSGGHREDSEVRGGSQPSPLPAYPVLGQRVNWEAQGTGSGLCPAGLQSPHQGHPLAGPRPWGSSETLTHPCLYHLIAAAVGIGPSLQDLSGFGSCLRPEHLAPSVMTAGQGLETWSWRNHQLRSASS